MKNDIKKIYIACPEKLATGGTELLHQLFYKLKKIRDVEIFYYNFSKGNPIAERFNIYDVKYVTEIKDSPENLLIIPETCTQILFKYKKIKKSIWWLSVDNYFVSIKDTNSKFKRIIKTLIGKNQRVFDISTDNIIHLAQSQYAIDFLKKQKIENIQYLSDYLGKVFFESEVDYTSINKKNQVLYNPKKGIEFTKKIMNRFPQIKFIPLENMTPNEVAELCTKSKLYIDFGNHPGKDRFPREAAILGCAVITGKRGSAKFYEDVRIEAEYKFEDEDSQIDNIGKKITEIFDNYDVKIKDFQEYRDMIKNEEKEFEKDVKKIFG